MRLGATLLAVVASCGFALAEPAPVTETVHEALCRLIDGAAQDYGVEADFLPRFPQGGGEEISILFFLEASRKRDLAFMVPHLAASQGVKQVVAAAFRKERDEDRAAGVSRQGEPGAFPLPQFPSQLFFHGSPRRSAVAESAAASSARANFSAAPEGIRSA